MINTLLLGSKGNLGKYIYSNSNELDLNIFTHKDKDISKVLNYNFILENEISLIINCIGENSNPANFYHSNFYVTSYLTFFLFSLDKSLNKNLTVIHFSSVGIHNPYETFSHKIVNDRIYPPLGLDLNKYELSKRCSDSLISTIPKFMKNINILIIEPSILIGDNSDFMKKLFILLMFFPFKLPQETFPCTNYSTIKKSLYKKLCKIKAKKEKLPHYERIQLIDHISIRPLIKKIPLYRFRLKATRKLTFMIIQAIKVINPKGNTSKILSLFLFDV